MPPSCSALLLLPQRVTFLHQTIKKRERCSNYFFFSSVSGPGDTCRTKEKCCLKHSWQGKCFHQEQGYGREEAQVLAVTFLQVPRSPDRKRQPAFICWGWQGVVSAFLVLRVSEPCARSLLSPFLLLCNFAPAKKVSCSCTRGATKCKGCSMPEARLIWVI